MRRAEQQACHANTSKACVAVARAVPRFCTVYARICCKLHETFTAMHARWRKAAQCGSRHALCYHVHGNVPLLWDHGGYMGKYFIAWLLGVPATLLILVYLFTHIF